MKEITVEPLTLCTTKLTLFFGDFELGSATGFFYRTGGDTYLISNWHVFSGRCPRTGQARMKTGSIPDAFQIRIFNNVTSQIHMIKFPIKAIFQHKRGQEVDIAFVHLQGNLEEYAIHSLPIGGKDDDLLITPAMDVFILGYPLGISKQLTFPIWKRASIASEPHYPIVNESIILVDTATREGMSGSPVVALSFSSGLMADGNVTFGKKYYHRLIGVYSGRYGADDELAAQLGIVWKKELLDEMLSNPAPLSFELR